MDGTRVGRLLRAVRLRLGLRQRDVAERAGISQAAYSRAERGRLEDVSIRHLDRIGEVLRITFHIDGRWRDGDADRLIDHEHAAIVEIVVKALRGWGWEVLVEYEFNHFGSRGSVDIVAWHAATRTLLIVEVKSRLTNLQAMFTSLATKVRVVPQLRRERGWDGRQLGRLVVMPGTTQNRSVVRRHAATFNSLFPERMPALRSWLRRPDRSLGGIWFLSELPPATTGRARRVRVRRSG